MNTYAVDINSEWLKANGGESRQSLGLRQAFNLRRVNAVLSGTTE